MARSGFGIGMIMLLIAMAIVLVLVAKAWRSVAPEALEVSGGGSSTPLDAHGQEEAAGELRSGELPRLHDAQERTDAHAARTQQALEAIE